MDKKGPHQASYQSVLERANIFMPKRKHQPGYFNELRQILQKPRPELQIIQQGDFLDFCQKIEEVKSEHQLSKDITSPLLGLLPPDTVRAPNCLINGLRKFRPDIKDAKPNVYDSHPYGLVDDMVETDLKILIQPDSSEQGIAPNNFVELKGPGGSWRTGMNQILHYGALGSRAMHELLNYGEDKPVFDGVPVPRAFSTLYCSQVVFFHAHHVEPGPNLEPYYYTTCIDIMTPALSKDDYIATLSATRNLAAHEQRYARKLSEKQTRPRSTSKPGAPSNAPNSRPRSGSG